MASLGRRPGAAPLTTADIPDGSITAAKVTADVATQAEIDLKANLTSAVLVTPNLGTPSAGVMTNMTGAVTASIVDDAVTGAKIENNPTIAGNLTVTGDIVPSTPLSNRRIGIDCTWNCCYRKPE